MTQTHELRALYDALSSDTWRAANPFSEDIETVNELLFNSYASDTERELQLLNWLQKFQPCVFGRVAAAETNLHFCFLDDTDMQRKSDQQIRAAIQESLRNWKRRSVVPTEDFSTPAHGFVLAVFSSRLAHAAPNAALSAFCVKLRDLWGCSPTETELGNVHWETLYLKKPNTAEYIKFQFTIDFFAAQGDRRWWHDHRCPGGVLFTANSVGHMMRYREWYKEMKDQSVLGVQNAMLTISNAYETDYGKATWLKPLSSSGEPIIRHLKCPFADPERVRPELKGKDWTRYGGYLHTDHSIRSEFFASETPAPSAEVMNTEFLQDFSYLYDQTADDNIRFIQGARASEQEVIENLGAVSEWTRVRRGNLKKLAAGMAKIRATISAAIRARGPKRGRQRVEALLARGATWRLTPEELRGLQGEREV